jgi:hypothetical protein
VCSDLRCDGGRFQLCVHGECIQLDISVIMPLRAVLVCTAWLWCVQAHKQLASVGKFPRDHPQYMKNDTSILPGIVVHSVNMTSWCWTGEILQQIRALRPMVTGNELPRKKVAGWVIGVAAGGAHS